MNEKTVADVIVDILHWAYDSPLKRERLTGAVEIWLGHNDDGIASSDDLAERFRNAVDIDELMHLERKGKITSVTGSWDKWNGFYYVTTYREGRERPTSLMFLSSGDPEKIQRHVQRVADMTKALVAKAYEMVTVQWVDLDGLPRAWAVGPRYALDEVKDTAKANFDAYVAKKQGQGLSLPNKVEDFREVIVSLEESDNEES